MEIIGFIFLVCFAVYAGGICNAAFNDARKCGFKDKFTNLAIFLSGAVAIFMWAVAINFAPFHVVFD